MSFSRIQSVFKALADDTRRAVILRLIPQEHGESLSALANHYNITRQGITKHIKILLDAGLVKEKKRGREVLISANPGALKWAYQWLNEVSEGHGAFGQPPKLNTSKNSTVPKKEEKVAQPDSGIQNLADFLNSQKS